MCGWLSAGELARALSAAPSAGRARAEALRLPMNAMLRKYSVASSRLRAAHFLAQIGHETGWWQFREELGNERYFQTMYEAITVAEAAADYRSGLAQRLNLVKKGESEQAYAARRPSVVAIKAQGMNNGLAGSTAGGTAGDGSRFRGRGFLQITGRRNYTSYGVFRGLDFTSDPKPSLLSSNDFNACDASGFYWVRERMSSAADAGAAPIDVTRVGGIVNRGSANKIPLHDNERQAAFGSIWSRLNETV
jgi:predicted chitinase